MSKPGDTPTDASPLKKPVSTGRENVVELPLFEVARIDCPAKWDPSFEKLPVAFEVNDPANRVRAGRIRYVISYTSSTSKGNLVSEQVVLHEQKLPAQYLGHGRFELTEAERWDGTISQGLPDRIGTKITGDLSPVNVRIEVWNSNAAAPGKLPDEKKKSGRTDVLGQYLSWKKRGVDIDVVVKAKWLRTNVIPWGDPDEPEKGSAKMSIELKNVPDGTAVLIQVLRIADIADAISDEPYAESSEGEEAQPGLVNAVVQGGSVKVNGQDPEVRFDKYDRHWTAPGNNFYCFQIAVGEQGGFIQASERDYVNKEYHCLHMRFTVFVHAPANDLKATRAAMTSLHKFFRNDTKYYRSYIRKGPIKSPQEWGKLFKHRFMVILSCHAGTLCRHPAHPTKVVKAKGKPDTTTQLAIYSEGFDADQNVCPRWRRDVPEMGEPEFIAPDPPPKKVKVKKAAGCNHAENVFVYCALGTKKKGIYFGNNPTIFDTSKLFAYEKGFTNVETFDLPIEGPRFFMIGDGCRTIITTGMGERLCKSGTKYYAGWIWTSFDDQAQMILKVMKKWIVGDKKNPAPNEWDSTRFADIYREYAKQKYYASRHPRLMEAPASVMNSSLAGPAKEAVK